MLHNEFFTAKYHQVEYNCCSVATEILTSPFVPSLTHSLGLHINVQFGVSLIFLYECINSNSWKLISRSNVQICSIQIIFWMLTFKNLPVFVVKLIYFFQNNNKSFSSMEAEQSILRILARIILLLLFGGLQKISHSWGGKDLYWTCIKSFRECC